MKVLGITGGAGVGKDTLARFLIENHGYVRISFADPIRNFISTLTGLPYAQLVDGPAKEAPLDWLDGRSPRYMMQTLGTDWGREMVDPDLWLKVAQRAVDAAREAGAPGVVFPDVRFDNEAAFVIEKLGGTIARVERDAALNVGTHKSEAGIAAKYVTHWVINNRSVEYLAHHAKALV